VRRLENDGHDTVDAANLLEAMNEGLGHRGASPAYRARVVARLG
jgi:hypothetical protein